MKISIYTKMVWAWQIISNFAKLSDFVANCVFENFTEISLFSARIMRWFEECYSKGREKGGKRAKKINKKKKKKVAATFESNQVNLRISSSHCTISFFFFSLRQLRHRLPSERHRDVNIVSWTIVPLVFNWIFSNDIAIELRHQWNFLPPHPFSHATSYKADSLWTSFSSNNRGNIATDFSSIFLWNKWNWREK